MKSLMTAARASLRNGFAATLLTNLALLLGGIASSVVISRTLGPVGRGEYVKWQTWFSTIALAALGGLPQAVVLDRALRGRHGLGDLLRGLSRTYAIAALAVLIIGITLRPGWPVIVAALFMTTTTQLYAVGAAEEQRMGQMTLAFNVIRLLPHAAALLAMACLVPRAATAPWQWLVVVAGFQALALVLWYLPTITREGVVRAGTVGIAGAWRLAPANWTTQLQQSLDLLAVTVLCPHRQVAFYALGAAAQGAVVAVGQSVGMIWFSHQRQACADRRRKLHIALRRATVIAITMAIPVAAGSTIWVPYVYGKAFLPAVPVVVALCVVGVIRCLDYLLAQECLIAGKGSRLPLYRVPGLVVMAAGFLVAGYWSLGLLAFAAIAGLGHTASVVNFLRVCVDTSSDVAHNPETPILSPAR